MKALAIAAGIVFWTLVLGVAILVFLPGGNGGEPIATLTVEPAPPVTTSAPEAGGGLDLPPGFAVTGPGALRTSPPPAPAMTPPGTTMMPAPTQPGGQLQVPGRGSALDEDHKDKPDAAKMAAASAGAAEAPQEAPQVAAADLKAGIDATGSIPLPEVPAPALVEQSRYGPLPQVAADGRRPADVYARPSDYGKVTGGPPRVAVLVAGLGVPGAPDVDVIKGLPPPVSIAYGAYGHSLQELVTKARADGHEVLLALPLEPNDYPDQDPGPHTLLTTLPTDENLKRLHWLMSRYTGYVGVTNHMGAKFESERAAFQPVLEELKTRGLIYLDDGSAKDSTAGEIARGIGLDFAVAEVRLEPGDTSAKMAEALAALEAAAKARGAAIGVAKAAPATVKQIADWAGSLEAKGLVLVPVSAAMRSQRQS